MPAPIRKLFQILEFLLFYTKEFLLSNLRVAADVLTPGHRMTPSMLRAEVGHLSDRQILVLGNLVTMTPGTLSIDVEGGRKQLLIHAMYSADPKAEVRDLQTNYVERIRRVF